MRDKKGLSIIELLEVAAIVAILAAIIYPVFIKAAKSQGMHCQSNMSQIGKAMKMYLSDWGNTYPTNRQIVGSGSTATVGPVLPWIRLSNPALVDANNEPIRFQYGFNWVEALYPYTDRSVTEDRLNVWKCPATRPFNGPAQGMFPSVTYSFNVNFIELRKYAERFPAKTMMCRELDRRYDSVLRPLFTCTSSSIPPNDPFLDPGDVTTQNLKTLRSRLHDDGSNILFADGHVKNFSSNYFSKPSGEWDGTTAQWYNQVTGAPGDVRIKAIAINP